MALQISKFSFDSDLAVMDESGRVTMAGRGKDMVIRGGENLYPIEIEQILYTHPDIEDVQVSFVIGPSVQFSG